MRQKTVRQKEIAELSGVSIATISRVLNDQPGVSLELREKILDLIGQTNYSPDMMGHSLAIAATRTAAFVTHKFDDGAADDPFRPSY
jgi:DNA-binding LacI/PurR family transcriptional regulator